MSADRIVRPSTLEEAAEALHQLGPGARLVAGGTDTVTQLRRGAPSPTAWVDLSAVQGVSRTISLEGDKVTIGALVGFQTIAESALIQKTLPALSDAANIMGSIQIRTRGTLGGNLGNASPAGDSLPPLMVGDASLRLLSARGVRELPVSDFFVGPGRTRLEAGELIVSVTYPLMDGAWSGFERIGTRTAHEIAKVSAAVRARRLEGRLAGVRIALGAVAPTPIRILSVEAWLEGKTPEASTLAEAARRAGDAARPIDDIRSTAEYRAEMCRVLVQTLFERMMAGASDAG